MLRFILAVAALAAVTTASADVYKSVDAQGEVHYSDHWTPGAQLIKSDRPREPASAPATTTAAPNNHTAAPDPGKTLATKQVQSDMDAVRAEQCKELKVQYDKLIHARRIYQPNADSSAPREYMSDADADAERVKTRQAMDEACADGTG